MIPALLVLLILIQLYTLWSAASSRRWIIANVPSIKGRFLLIEKDIAHLQTEAAESKK